MSKKFATPLAITGTKEQLDAFLPKLGKLGYLARGRFYGKDHIHLVTNHAGFNSEVDYSAEPLGSQDRIVVSADNEELVLALAAMVEGPEFHPGEMVVLVSDGGMYTKNGSLAVVNEGKDYSYTSFRWLTNMRGGKNTEIQQDNGGYSDNIFRKATKEEIIAHFTPKEGAGEMAVPAEPEFVLPEKWYIVRNKENYKVLNEWEKTKNRGGEPFLSDRAYFFPDKGYRSGTRHIEDYTEITFEQFQKYVLKQEIMEKKIIGYKSPKDLFGGSLKAGTEYRKPQPGYKWYAPYTDYNKKYFENTSSNYGDFGQTLAAEIVEEWEPVYEEEFKVGDWVVFEHSRAEGTHYSTVVWNRDMTLQITEVGDIYYGFDTISNAKYLFRKATPAEIEAAQTVEIRGYKAQVTNNRLAFGCKEFSKADLLVINRLFDSEIQAEIKIGGVDITPELLGRLIGRLK